MLSALMLMGALSGCGAGAEGGPERFPVRACVCSPVASLDPALNTDAKAEAVFHAVYENLMRIGADEEGNPVVLPGVAREYEVVENFDGTVDYVFTLRSSARWSDGTRVKAKDFVYAWYRLVNPVTASPNHALLSMVKGYDAARESGDASQLAVRADGDATLRVTLSWPCPYFISEICTAAATMPLRSDVAGKNPDWATSSTLPCNGPFKISVWSKRESLYLQRNGSYHDRRTVTPDSLRFIFSSSLDQAMRYFADGLVDYVADPAPGTEGEAGLPERSAVCVLYNHMSDAFSNGHVRRAFDLTIDRAAVAALSPALTPATGLVPFGVADVGGDFRDAGGALIDADEGDHAWSLAEAENELRLSGFWGRESLPALRFLCVEEDGALPLAEQLAAGWREALRASVTVESLPREEFDLRVASGEYDLALDTLRLDYGDAMVFLAPFAGLDANNALHYVSKPYDLLIAVAASSPDGAARSAMLHDAEALLLEDTALSPVCFGGRTYLLRSDLTGVVHDVRGNARFAAVREIEQPDA